jgi:hypothetical protein
MSRIVNPSPRVCIVNIIFEVPETVEDESYKATIEHGIAFSANITQQVRQMAVAVVPGTPQQYGIPSGPVPPPVRRS